MAKTSRKSVFAVAVAVVAIAACLTGIRNEFTQDDIAILRDSDVLHDFFRIGQIVSSPYWPPPYTSDQYRPVTSVFLALQYAIGGPSPLVFRVFSYTLYAAASVAVFALASELLPLTVALGIALLFAVHPVHVEALTLAVGQAELLVALMGLLMVRRYLGLRRDQESGEVATTKQKREWVILAALYAVASLSKEQGLMLPAFLVAAELCLVQGRPLRQRLRSQWPGYVVLGCVAAAVLIARFAVLGAHAVQPNVAEALVTKTLAGRAVTMLQIVPQWLRLLAWPAHLRADYSPREFVGSSHFGRAEWFGLALLLGLLALGWRARRRAPVVTFGLLWLGLALFPVSNVFIPTGILIAERTLFLPSIGFLLAVGGAVAYGLQRLETRAVLKPALAVACLALVIAGGARSARRMADWRSSDTLSLASIADSPKSWRVWQSYAESMFRNGQSDDGVLAYHRAIDLAPSPWWPQNALARHLRALGRDEEAVVELRLSILEHPGQVDAYPELAAALIATGNYREAQSLAQNVIRRAGAPPIMVWLAHVADSAMTNNVPAGQIRIGVHTQAQLLAR
ncbi:MAG TPA: hypothetical protein VFT29_05530 [Gemmatimonadaceae bacterium]|nr:hypothetical protein [Gemmatimonadaceae bacterium]